jgi:mannobiose 2-epimerase
MYTHILRSLFFISGFSFVFSVSYSQSVNKESKIRSEMHTAMVDNLLRPWYPASIDSVYGGFISAFEYDFRKSKNQDKMIVSQARHIWSTSKAAIRFPEKPYFLEAARQGFEFLKQYFWDHKNGGFHTLTDQRGNVKSSYMAPKEAYGNAFAIYGLAAYYQASGDTSALNLAIKGFNWLEEHSHDPVHLGYFQHMTLVGAPIQRLPSTPSTAALGYKDQNSSIHLLEAFTELYQVWPDPLLKKRLNEMLLLIRDTITTPKGTLTLFFKPDWTPVSFRDSSEAVQKQHKGLDHVSFGHDVETAFLMLEASHVLGLKNDKKTLKVAKKMVDHALEQGWDSKVGGFYDEGYYFKDKPGMTIIADSKNWWAQAEGLNSLLMMSALFPNDKHQYQEKFKQLWQYCQTYLIDHEHGDWYMGGLDKQPYFKTAQKGQIWKTTYHNLRSLMHCVDRLDQDVVPPTTPVGFRIDKINDQIILSWEKSTDDRLLLGYEIYNNGEKIGFTPKTHFSIKAIKAANFSVRAIDYHHNLSRSTATLKYL